jgi:hypothetical protein
MSNRWLTVVAAVAFGVTARADDPPKPPPGSGVLNPNRDPQMQSAGQAVAKVSKVDGGTITVKRAELEPAKGGGSGSSRGRGRPRLNVTEKDHDVEMASDVKVRWHDLPKKADGKPYTDKEYQALRDPPDTPGYKADVSDLKAGQTVRLHLSKAGKAGKPVATVVEILADAPQGSEPKKPEKPKKKKKD